MNRSFFLVLLLFTTVLFSQDLLVKETVLNTSNTINDGMIDLDVSGGTPPYTYKWSHQSTPLSSKRAIGLTEGIPYMVTVSDSLGASVTKEYKVATQAITEVFNAFITPAVSALGSVLFCDPLAAIGIYDPHVYADAKRIGIPGWSTDTRN